MQLRQRRVLQRSTWRPWRELRRSGDAAMQRMVMVTEASTRCGGWCDAAPAATDVGMQHAADMAEAAMQRRDVLRCSSGCAPIQLWRCFIAAP